MEHYRDHREIILVLTAPRRGKKQDAPYAPADRSKVRGYVQSISATWAFALVWDGTGQAHVPLALVRAIRIPFMINNPEDGEPVAAPPPRGVIELPESQLSLW